MGRTKVGVLASGRGTDFRALVDASEAHRLGADLVIMICNNREAPVIERARHHGIPSKYIDHRGKSRETFDAEVAAILEAQEVDLVVLAGFMRLLSPAFVERFRYRIINVHPSLLPAFPGAHAHREAIAYGVRVSGCTVHFVDESVDGGPVILQQAVAVRQNETEESLAARILQVEHRLLPLAVRLFSDGRLRLEGRRVLVDTRGLPPGVVSEIQRED